LLLLCFNHLRVHSDVRLGFLQQGPKSHWPLTKGSTGGAVAGLGATVKELASPPKPLQPRLPGELPSAPQPGCPSLPPTAIVSPPDTLNQPFAFPLHSSSINPSRHQPPPNRIQINVFHPPSTSRHLSPFLIPRNCLFSAARSVEPRLLTSFRIHVTTNHHHA
jgi:hypothetical protein